MDYTASPKATVETMAAVAAWASHRQADISFAPVFDETALEDVLEVRLFVAGRVLRLPMPIARRKNEDGNDFRERVAKDMAKHVAVAMKPTGRLAA